MLTQTENWRPELDRFQRTALITGVVGAVICGVGALLGPAQFFHSLLYAFFFWMVLTIGASIVLMIQYLTGGVWGLMIRRMLEAAMKCLPVMFVVFIVLLAGLSYNYKWMIPEEVAKSAALQFKAGFLNAPFFIVRGVLYFAGFMLVAYILTRWSANQDKLTSADESLKLSHRIARLAGPGIPIFVMIWTFGSTDWGMSLEPEWVSSMYPVIFIVEGMLATFAWSIVALSIMRSRKMLPYNVPVDRLHDLGKFMFAFVILWTYVSFSQLLIIWSGNIPEETPWYAHRFEHGWGAIGILLIIGHFFLPLFALISRHPKRRFETATPIAMFIIAIQAIYIFWAVMPSFFPEGFHINWLDFVAPIAVGGFWLAMWAWNLKQLPLLPPMDPRMVELEKQAAGNDHGHAPASHAAH